jgi:hypothetical protein
VGDHADGVRAALVCLAATRSGRSGWRRPDSDFELLTKRAGASL